MAAYLSLLGAAFLWGTSFVAGKFALGIADAPLVVLGRFLIASAFWLPASIRASKSLPRAQWGPLLVLAFLMIPATFLLQFIGLQYTTASSAAIMIGFEPLMVVLLGCWLWKEKLTVRDIGFSLMAGAGVVLVMGWPGGARFFGCALVLLSTVVVALWVRWSKTWMNTMSISAFTSLTTVAGTVLLVPCALLLTRSWRFEWSLHGSVAFLYLGVGCSLAAGWLWNLGLKGVPANVGGLFLALEPVFGLLAAALLLHEPMGGVALAGAVLVIFPVVVSAILPLFPSSLFKRRNR